MSAPEELIQRIERSWDVLVQTFEGVDDEKHLPLLRQLLGSRD